MLVLTRKSGESLVIDDVIQVTVLEVRGSRVRLGVVAPESVHVIRQELQIADAESHSEEIVACRC